MDARPQQWMLFWPPFLTAGTQFVKNTSSIELNNYMLNLLIRIKPCDRTLGQPLWKRLPASDWADPLIPCHRRGEWLHHGGDVF